MPPRKKYMECTPPCDELKNTQFDLKIMQKDIEEIKQTTKEIKDIIKAQEKRFSAKWVENAMTGLIVLLVLSALYTIIEKAGLTVR